MSSQFIELVLRDGDSTDTCDTQSSYNGSTNMRVLALFIILISSGLGSFFPILASTYSFIRLPDCCFFVAKFFGSGVIVATAFIHLLDPAVEALSNTCLGGTFTEYPWAFGICLMSLFLLFLIEIMTHHMLTHDEHGDGGHSHGDDTSYTASSIDDKEADSIDADVRKDANDDSYDINSILNFDKNKDYDIEANHYEVSMEDRNNTKMDNYKISQTKSTPGQDHFSHDSEHQDLVQLGTPVEQLDKEKYMGQIVSVIILEFGVIFHSIFTGLSLAVSGDEFETLFIVLVFHQMFEGLGLGTRIAETNWPKSKKNTPWLLALGFTISTPIAIGIGIGVRYTFIPGSRTALITNGIFDSISSGILIYTGLVELMAHEFLFSKQFSGRDGFKKMIFAYVIMCCGAALMALLGKWA
ncbi:hypothetical protein TPHA_0A01550 [Tetrapisispora phaffii CBS 4417]|uniref:Uncharacterized protein n=1 Tax=Tetrapisispora phaffii (strain ATCC 24235 / CBS 4417 / NBRC 1672 / NRRL Y-8282 / UCD 70-5) TaxID=1071381 RepID=G8BMW0_TETPH|nr:hypothetical protein TPHA_0A01550 [Tetrapisispora phaffii CBS 4417]CCE61238.1 hypothetical protein TPHA_0A01550 [Tetrapisispora phaffii CBS 4417]